MCFFRPPPQAPLGRSDIQQIPIAADQAVCGGAQGEPDERVVVRIPAERLAIIPGSLIRSPTALRSCLPCHLWNKN